MNTHARTQTPSPIILLTDFGTLDAYVGTMKGVILRTCWPDAPPLIDLTHEVAPQDVRGAAFVLWTAYRYFPPQSVFIVVVDPGVGSARRGMAVETPLGRFVAPDNGVLSEVLAEVGSWRAVALDPAIVGLPGGLSKTFHGRDLFAPAAARLACGASLDSLGPPLESPVRLEPPRLEIDQRTITGEIIHIDHFGNAVTSIALLTWRADGKLTLQPRYAAADPFSFAPDAVTVQTAGQTFGRIAMTYSDVPPRAATPLIGSSGHLEIGVNQGGAASTLGLHRGDRITLTFT
ncbi:MAG: SAM-dependent chlorinase/fluorinase [Anaerolineae bacterium]|nr:SAM-dependent chlorinase/fluorinase [Anaerolineae bacterium]